MNWQSTEIPLSIRRPWRISAEHFEDKLEGAASEGDLTGLQEVRQRIATVQERDALAAYLDLPVEQQRSFVEVSLLELAAFASWRASKTSAPDQPSRRAGSGAEEWDMLNDDEKVEYVPEDPRACLRGDVRWAALLADAPPPCGPAVEPEAGSVAGMAAQQRADEADAEAEEVVDAVELQPAANNPEDKIELVETTPLHAAVQAAESGPPGEARVGKRGDNSARTAAKRNTKGCVSETAPFEKEVATIVKAHGKSLNIAAEAKSLLRVAAEAFLTGIFEDSKVVMMHSKRSTLFPEDVRIVKKLRRS